MTPSAHALQSLSLTEFRSYDQLDFAVGGRSVYLYGPNGAGKTNLLEAISVLTPGKGLRGVAYSELGRRLPGEGGGKPWGVVARLHDGEDAVQLATGADPRDRNKRTVRIDQQPVPAARLLDHLRMIWLTPAQDRLFIEGRAERLRFFDRLVYAAQPGHAAVVSAYEKALRERLRLLTEGRDGGGADETWLNVLEETLAINGARMMTARQDALVALQDEIEGHGGAFPKADLALTRDHATGDLAEGFRRARGRDGEAGRSLYGPHRMDLEVMHRDKNRPAADCSTGEQKALLLNIILAQGARLAKGEGASLAKAGKASPPLLLLDEVAAHLDPVRRHALFDETHALGLQTFFTGTDLGLFDGLKHRALGVRVEAGQFIDFLE